MNNLTIKSISQPAIKVNVTRIERMFLNSDSYKNVSSSIIKDYVYSPQKRIIA